MVEFQVDLGIAVENASSSFCLVPLPHVYVTCSRYRVERVRCGCPVCGIPLHRGVGEVSVFRIVCTRFLFAPMTEFVRSLISASAATFSDLQRSSFALWLLPLQPAGTALFVSIILGLLHQGRR